MPYDFVTDDRQYTFNGRPVSRQELRVEIEKLLTYVQKEAARIADDYQNGTINISQFQVSMQELLKAGHVIAASVGRGGRSRMTVSDWGTVGQRIKTDYEYLAKFSRGLARGGFSKAYSAHRARTYASSLYVTFSRTEQETKTEYIPGADNPERIFATLVQSSQEGCDECTADADEGPQPIEDILPIGDRLCGQFCLCVLEFTDADGNEI